MRALLSIFALLLLTPFIFSQPYGTGPIIGIVTIPSEVAQYPPDEWSFFPSSYVKYIESGGAQVVPIQYDLPQDKLVYLLERLNGVFLTGGGSVFVDAQGNLTRFGQTIQFIVNFILEENMMGNYYPLWGTCQGFEAIAMVLSRNFSILDNCANCHGVNKNNVFESAYNSRLFAQLPEDLKQKMCTNNITYFSESYDLGIHSFKENTYLSSIVTPITYTYDAAGVMYVSSYESPYFPIYATQFHPEKSTFEWVSRMPYNHGYDAISLQLYLAGFLADEARKSPNTFPDNQLYLIDNWNVTIQSQAYSSIYVFPAIPN